MEAGTALTLRGSGRRASPGRSGLSVDVGGGRGCEMCQGAFQQGDQVPSCCSMANGLQDTEAVLRAASLGVAG